MNWLSSDDGLGTHISIFIMLLLGGFGFPIPEDVPLVLAGVAASQGVVRLQAIFLTSYIGVLLADQIIYLIGYCFGQKLLARGTRSTFFPSITEHRVHAIREGLRKRRFIYILLGRHFFPLRTATFLIAGTLAIPYLEFLAADALAALLSVGLVVWLGYWRGAHLTPEMINHFVHRAHYYVLIIMCVAAVVWLITHKASRRKSERVTEQKIAEKTSGL